MLLSMTGHGEAELTESGVQVGVEVRTINSRYFKLSVRSGEGYYGLEPRIETIVRKHIRRGTVQVSLRIEREWSADDFRLNRVALASYRKQLESLYDELHVADSVDLGSLLILPGVVDERSSAREDVDSDWPMIAKTLETALENLTRMRCDEGQAMVDDLRSNGEAIAEQLDVISQRAPTVIEGYRTRITERMNKLMGEFDIKLNGADVAREVAMFAERTDISEEVVRLRSHLEQFRTMLQDDDSGGRKLDFLVQEMFRETNTIGSKANDAEIAKQVIEIKAGIERMREMIQNVE